MLIDLGLLFFLFSTSERRAKEAADHYHSLARLAMTRNQDYERQYRELEQRYQSQQQHFGT
jgi:phage shock protein A